MSNRTEIGLPAALHCGARSVTWQKPHILGNLQGAPFRTEAQAGSSEAPNPKQADFGARKALWASDNPFLRVGKSPNPPVSNMSVSITKHTFLLRPQIRSTVETASNSSPAQPSPELGSACIINLPGPWWSGWYPLMVPSTLSPHSAYLQSVEGPEKSGPCHQTRSSCLLFAQWSGQARPSLGRSSWKYRLNGNHLSLGQALQGSGDHLGGTFSWGWQTAEWLVFFAAYEWLGELGSSLQGPALPRHPHLKSLSEQCLLLPVNVRTPRVGRDWYLRGRVGLGQTWLLSLIFLSFRICPWEIT